MYALHQAPTGDRIECQGEQLSFEDLARRRGISEDDARGLRGTGFTARTLCDARQSIVETAVRKLTRAKPDSPGDWLEWRNLFLRDERGIIDPDGLMRAKAHIDLMRTASVAPTAAGITRGAWTSHGPGNVGGRIRAMAIHPASPTTIFIGSVSGGIWVTTNGGTSWAPVNDFMANLAVSTLIMQPGTPSTMYAGTGEGFFNADGIRGAGIFKSSDGGAVWSQLPSTSTAPSPGLLASDFHYVNRLVMSPNGAVLLAATRTGIYRSTDGGATFSRATMTGGGAISVGNGIADVDFHGTDDSRAVAATYAGTALYSTDGGLTWSLAAGLPGGGTFVRVETAIAPSDGTVVYASIDLQGGSLYRSSNGGQSYVEVFDGATDALNPLASQGWYDNLLWVAPNDPSFVIWGGIDLFRSTTSGSSFSRMSEWFSHSFSNPTSAHADQHIAIPHPNYNGTTNRIVYFGNDGGVYRADDVLTVGGGASPYRTGWSELNNGLAITQFYGAAGHPGTGRITAGTQDNGTLFFNPAVANAFENWTAPFGGDGGFSAYDSLDANYFYGEYVRAQIHRNTTGGVLPSQYIFSGIADAGTASAEFITAFIKDPNSNDRLLVPTLRLYRTNNAKAAVPAWEVIKNDADGSHVSAVAVAPGNSAIVYAGHNSGRLYRTTAALGDAVTVQGSWIALDNNGTVNPLPGRRITRITVDPSNINTVYVTLGGFSGNNIYRSLDAGASWTDVTGPAGGATALPDVPVRDLEVHPTNGNWIYAATEVGVFASEDAGASWALPHDGPANVSVDELFFLNTTLYAVTHGRGLFSANTNIVLPGLSISDVSISEGNSGTRNARFNVTMSAASAGPVTVGYATADGTARARETLANATAIGIPTSGNGVPYPSTVTVPAGLGSLIKVTVTLAGLSHSYPGDVDVLLAGPTGQTVLLMSDVGSSFDAEGVTLTFDDSAAATIPIGSALGSGVFRPTNNADNEGDDVFGAPAPSGLYGSALAGFVGTDPTGAWQLFVRDDFSGDGGTLSGGWSLTLSVAGDYVPTSGTVTFPPGSTLQPVDVAINGDVVIEPAETFTLNLSGAFGAVIIDAQGVATIRNDDFTDPLLSSLPIRGVHVTELRVAINDARMSKGLAPFSFTDPVLTPQNTVIKAIHLTELRTALAAAYGVAGLPPPSYTDPAITPGVSVARTAHITELRTAVQNLP